VRTTLERRVEELLARMTLDEKLAQIGCVWSTQLVDGEGFSAARARERMPHGIGHVTRIGASTGLRPHESAAFMNAIQRFAIEETRLGIPVLVHEESCAGYCARDATQFPQAIGLAASFDPAALERMAQVIRTQMLAVGARQTLAPVLDIARDPRWGRVEETFGEDPYLVSRLGVAYVRGIQGGDLRAGVAATGKHFIGYGLSEGGMNWAPAQIPPRLLRDVYAVPFEAAIREAGLASIMNAYNELDGLPCAGSRELLDDFLRGELGFNGIVVADYFAVATLCTYHKVAADKAAAGRMALEAGIDVELPATDCYAALRPDFESGALPMELLDRSVRRMLRLKFELGLFEAPYVDAERASAAFDTAEQRALARELAQKAIVLLANEHALLPLSRELSSLAVIGPSSDDVRLMLGDYHYPAHLEIIYKNPSNKDVLPRSDAVAFRPGPYYGPIVTPLEGIRAAVSAATRIRVARGCELLGDARDGFAEAVEIARASEVAIVCVGGRSGLVDGCTSGEMTDRAELGLPGAQQALVEAVIASGTPTLVVVIDGRPLALPWLAQHASALLHAWVPGEQGGNALADLLFGAVSPSARLPVSLPRSVGQVPVYYGHKPSGGRSMFRGHYVDSPSTPLYAFGHGLSYTSFAYRDLLISPLAIEPDGAVEISLQLQNTGARAGDEVVQLYVNDEIGSVSRPVAQLVGFARVPLSPGQTRRVVFRLDASQLAFHDRELRLIVEPGRFKIMVGASSADIRLEGHFAVVGKLRELRMMDRVATAVEVV
jgi:beta-glucosidase